MANNPLTSTPHPPTPPHPANNPPPLPFLLFFNQCPISGLPIIFVSEFNGTSFAFDTVSLLDLQIIGEVKAAPIGCCLVGVVKEGCPYWVLHGGSGEESVSLLGAGCLVGVVRKVTLIGCCLVGVVKEGCPYFV